MTTNSYHPSLFKPNADNVIKIVESSITSELVIALCGPIGSPLHVVAEHLKTIIENDFNYCAQIYTLSKYIETKKPKESKPKINESHFERVMRLIKEGNQLRSDYGSSSLADLAIHDIHMQRREQLQKTPGETHFEPVRKCHIIDSIKNQEELDILKSVYGNMAYCIGVLSPISQRVDYLKGRQIKDSEIYELIDKDSGEEVPHGQTVRDTFPLSDFFLRIGSRNYNEIDIRLKRFLQIMLDVEIITPTIEEHAMFLAASAAMNSACLSRQVGAAVTDSKGAVLGVGWNDVPMTGGGLYNSNRVPDNRCINIEGGKCENDLKKNQLRETIALALINANVIRPEAKGNAISAMNNSKIKDLLEFSRSIHAEMHAIITAAQKTADKMINGTLFCTTYPCHSCARHIVAAGITTVYYIEPYRKSLAMELHHDAISKSEKAIDKVRILAFDGVAPTRYIELFKMRPESRKKEGVKRVNNPKDAIHKLEVNLEPFTYLEQKIVQSLLDRNLIDYPRSAKEGARNESQRKTSNTNAAESGCNAAESSELNQAG